MNFLAHIYLSGENEEILLGNFIGDAVKGKDFSKFSDLVKKGLSLHRFIDSFTDGHYLVRKSKFLLYSHYHKYAGVVTDIFYDYFLSIYWNNFSEEPLREFIYRKYETLFFLSPRFPNSVKRIFPFFVWQNWLECYTRFSGIEKVLRQMAMHTSLPDEANFAMHVLDEHYDDLKDHFLEFFPIMLEEVTERYNLHFPEITTSKEFLPSA